MDVRLTPTGPVTDALVAAAVDDAAADEVTPPLTPGPAWTPERIAWLADYLRAAPSTLGPAAGDTAAWAVVADAAPVGAVRLKRLDRRTVETGIWLARAARRRGVARTAIGLTLDEARRAGATEVRADTTTGNHAAQFLLRRLGFTLGEPDGENLPAALTLGGVGSGS